MTLYLHPSRLLTFMRNQFSWTFRRKGWSSHSSYLSPGLLLLFLFLKWSMLSVLRAASSVALLTFISVFFSPVHWLLLPCSVGILLPALSPQCGSLSWKEGLLVLRVHGPVFFQHFQTCLQKPCIQITRKCLNSSQHLLLSLIGLQCLLSLFIILGSPIFWCVWCSVAFLCFFPRSC